MSLTELMEWMAYYEVEPWGSKVDGMRLAVNTAGVYNAGLMQANPKQLKKKPFYPKEFYVGLEHKESTVKKKQTWQQQRDMLNLIAVKR